MAKRNRIEEKDVKPSWKEQPATAIPNRLILSGKDIPPAVFKVYAVVIHYNPSYPKLETIAAEAGCSKTTVLYAIYVLELKKIIKVIGGSQQRSNLYRRLPESEWKLQRKPLSHREWQKARKLQQSNRWTTENGPAVQPLTSSSATVAPLSSATVALELEEVNQTNITLREKDRSEGEGNKRKKGWAVAMLEAEIERIKRANEPSNS